MGLRHRHQQRVEAWVVGQLRVEGGEHDPALADGDRVAVEGGEHRDLRPGVLDPRRSNEDGPDRLGPQALHDQVGLEARELPAEGVSPRDDIDQAEVVAVADDHPGAGAEDRPPGMRVGADGLGEPVALDRFRDRRRLAAGDHEGLDAFQLSRSAHLDRVGADRLEHPGVGREIALAGQHANRERLCAPRPRGERGVLGAHLDAAVLEQLARRRKLGDVVATHRLAELDRRGGDPLGVAEVRRRLDDGPGAPLRVLGLEDP